MFVIKRTVDIACAHHLTKFPQDHKCHRPHGHNYRIEVTIEGVCLNERDVLVDYGVIDTTVRAYDHRDLNAIVGLNDNPTAERLAIFLGERIQHAVDMSWTGTSSCLPAVVRVDVHENGRSVASWCEG